MVENFNNRNLLRTRNRLREFIVIHQNQLPGRRPEQIALGDDSLHTPLRPEHGEYELRCHRNVVARLPQCGIDREAGEIGREHLSRCHSRTRQKRRRGGIMR